MRVRWLGSLLWWHMGLLKESWLRLEKSWYQWKIMCSWDQDIRTMWVLLGYGHFGILKWSTMHSYLRKNRFSPLSLIFAWLRWWKVWIRGDWRLSWSNDLSCCWLDFKKWIDLWVMLSLFFWNNERTRRLPLGSMHRYLKSLENVLLWKSSSFYLGKEKVLCRSTSQRIGNKWTFLLFNDGEDWF